MKANIIKIFWGVVLIVLGGFIFADKLGYVDLELVTRQIWSIIFASLSAFFFLCYFLDGVRKWGWLFPALLFAALALILAWLLDSRSGPVIAIPVILCVGIPFYVGYLLDRRQWGLLIPAWIMTVISVILVLAEGTHDDLIGATVLYAIAFPFLVVYLAGRQRTWALITGLVLAFIGLFPLLAPILPDDISGPVVMFLFTLFFIAMYFLTKKSWWALIPAGIFASIGVVALLDTLLPNNAYFMVGKLEFNVYTGVLLLGFAVTFGILWLLRGAQPTAWAKYPAIGLLILSLLALLMWKTASDLVTAIALLVIGSVLILGSVFKRREPQQFPSRNT